MENRVIVLQRHGGPEQLKLESWPVSSPGAGELLIRQTIIGVNFIDIYQRTGLYPVPKLPAVLGLEGAGFVEAVGQGVKDFREGDAVVYATGPLGAYAAFRTLPAEKAVRVPSDLSLEQVGGWMLRGLTVEYLVQRCFPVKKGQTVLWHAAAGGVGLIAGAWLKEMGVIVLGTAGSDEKRRKAKNAGFTEVFEYDDFPKRVREFTNGRGVAAVFDSVGAATLEGSLDCLAPRGMLVSFGNASGAPAPIDLLELSRRGSLFVTRPTLFHYTATREELEQSAETVFEKVRLGVVRVSVTACYPLEQAAAAQEALEKRKTTGPVVLVL